MKVGSSTFGLFASRSLAEQSRVISRALSRLSSGKRLQGPQEDAAAFSLSQRLESLIRSSVARQGVMNLERSELEQTQAGLQVQTEIVQRMKELSVKASQSTLSAQERGAIRMELVSLRQEFDRVAGENSSLQYSSEVIRTSDGTGEFRHLETLEENAGAGLALGDLDGDGNQDLVYSTTTGIEVRLGNGDGSFKNAVRYAATLVTDQELHLKDLNNDGVLEVIVADAFGLFTFIGHGDGSFASAQTHILQGSTGGEVTDVDFGDFNADGVLDIAFTEDTAGFVGVLLGDGDGGFLAPQSLSENGESNVKVGDLDGDGNNDVLVSNNTGAFAYLGDGSGNFSSVVTIATGFTQISSLELSDRDADGDLDIFIGDGGADQDVIYNNAGGMSFSAVSSVGTGGASLQFADINGDGYEDVFSLSGFLSVFINGGRGTYPSQFSTQDIISNTLAVADLDNDGVLDVVGGYLGDLYIGTAILDEKAAAYLMTVEDVESAQKLQGALDLALDDLVRQSSAIAIGLNSLDRQYDYESRMQEARESSYAAIMDPDIALETSNLVAAQIQQQAIIASLAQANLQQQVVLGLLSF